MSRIPRPGRDQLDADQRRLYDAIASGRRASGPQLFPLVDENGGLVGPFNAMLLNPALGDVLQQLGAAVRYHGQLSPRSRELAILTVAAGWKCEFEQRAHESVGAHIGLTRSELAAVRAGGPLELDDAEEAAVVRTTRLLTERADLDDGQYAAAEAVLGAERLFELTTLVGYYSLLALLMRVYRVR